MAKVTVLTAVYNAERYLRQCLDSLAAQKLKDCQFICIDDCSTDSSHAILSEYAARDARFQILRTPVNSGQAKARNLGLLYAQGEYVAMLDADDWYDADTLQLAFDTLVSTGADCAVMNLIQHFEDDSSQTVFPIKSDKSQWSGEEAFRLSLDWSLHGLYVVKADIHKKYPFDDSCRLYSDDNTTRMHYLNSNRVVRCDANYYYRKHSQSMTNACSVRRFDYMLANLSMRRQLDKLDISNKDEVLRMYETHRWLNIVGCYYYYFLNKQKFSYDECKEIEILFSEMLQTIDSSLVSNRHKYKFGYYPIRNYSLFCFVEDAYFRLRQVLGR
ncbi:MAG: glycosyltransferase [Bacteroidaceae bacterium]|nr:glycosyltransferase [Bacteroidaceae bacterium]